MEEEYANMVSSGPMSESMNESKEMEKKYIPKQFDMKKLMSIEKDERDILIKLMTSQSGMFREETKTTLHSYGLIIDQREGTINNLLG